jgi:hypothetical protein
MIEEVSARRRPIDERLASGAATEAPAARVESAAVGVQRLFSAIGNAAVARMLQRAPADGAASGAALEAVRKDVLDNIGVRTSRPCTWKRSSTAGATCPRGSGAGSTWPCTTCRRSQAPKPRSGSSAEPQLNHQNRPNRRSWHLTRSIDQARSRGRARIVVARSASRCRRRPLPLPHRFDRSNVPTRSGSLDAHRRLPVARQEVNRPAGRAARPRAPARRRT